MQTAGLVMIKNRKLLLAFSNNKQAFYLPGGKVNGNETAIEALIREVKEELNVELLENDLTWYTHITAPAFGEKTGIIMEQDCFICELPQTPEPNAEIGLLKYFNTMDYPLQPQQVPGVVILLEKLKKEALID
jgi:ADP-ribose pyrophosphatase YjhB (NUDIX family)